MNPQATNGYQDAAATGPLQMKVLHQLWIAGKPLTVHEVELACNTARQGKPALAYTTYLTVMRNLARRGLIKQEKRGERAHYFTPLMSHEAFRASLFKHIVENLFNGDLAAFKSAASDHIHLSPLGPT